MKDKITRTYKVMTPIYQPLSEFRKSIESKAAVAIVTPGKITVYGKYIFVSEAGQGIHVIDNSNPSSPKNISFINIPGNEDMAISGSALYADSYADLVTFDISNPAKAIVKNFSTDAFPDKLYYYSNFTGTTNPDSINIITGWNTKDTTVNYSPGTYYYYPGGIFFNCTSCQLAAIPAASNGGQITGTNGSTARFAIINHFLYTVSTSQLTAFDITQNFSPVSSGSTALGWNIETIYPLGNTLFVGSTTGMFMLDVQSSPEKPVVAGQFGHVRSCDPVIADGNYAYVTLRSGTTCEGFSNELDILNITNLDNTSLVAVYQLNNPQGLSKDENDLFICDGAGGLKVYNVSDINSLQLVKQFKDDQMHDVIAQNGLAIALGNNGVYEYDYSDLNNIHRISKF